MRALMMHFGAKKQKIDFGTLCVETYEISSVLIDNTDLGNIALAF
jgi:hypothetical protein